MRYIEFGKEKRKVSEIVMGLMRIGEMSTKEVANLIELDTVYYLKGVNKNENR